MLTTPEKIRSIAESLKDEYLQGHNKPWILGFSGGKDSTLVLQLVCEMLLDLPPSLRTRTVHVLSNDTLVESPIVQNFVDEVLVLVRDSVLALELPVVVKKTTPSERQSFWVNLIGRGYPAPNRTFRWCTDRMKIQPTSDYIRAQVAESGEAILLLGVRRLESTARAKVMKRYDNGTRLNPHNNLRGCLVFRPIVELTTDEVWLTLLQRRPPWGGTHRRLATLYRNAQGGECPFVVDQEDAPSCGSNSSRFGCWTCTVVEKDKSMQGFIDAGFEQFEPLLDYRDWLKEFSANHRNRMKQRRNGAKGVGPFTPKARQELLRRLLHIQDEVGLTLISEGEITRIHEIWAEDESMLAKRVAGKMLALWDANPSQ